MSILILIVGAKPQNVQLQNEEVGKDSKDKLTFEFSLER